MSQVFDEKELLDRIDNDMDFLAETVEMLCTDGRALMDEIRSAIEGGDPLTLARAAHTLKGMISNFCSIQTHGVAFEIEKAGKRGDVSGAASLVDELQTRLDELIVALNEFLAARK
jgi:HPt (histidine-containing phosphotransfer) domain-containing protein